MHQHHRIISSVSLKPIKPILVAEDNPDEAELLKLAFLRAGLSNPLLFFENGELARTYLANACAGKEGFPLPILSLLDVKMPRLDGFELLQWAKAQELCKQLPFVMLTSSNDEKDIARATNLGADSYLVKPSTFGELIEMVKRLGKHWIIVD